MNFELCTDSLEGVLAAQEYGFKRVELCSALSIGGLTPSFGLIKESVVCAPNLEIHTLIRHREGDFNYNDEDIKVISNDIKAAKKAGAHGVVFGVLDKDYKISEINRKLVTLSKELGLEVTFHRAFDFVENSTKAIEKLVEFNFDRVLTSGLEATAEEGLETIKELQNNYGNDIQIMAGSGINPFNAKKIAESGIQNIHFTARKSTKKTVKFSMGNQMVVDKVKIEEIINQF